MPPYVARLDLPVASDQLLYPAGVTADLHTGEVFVADMRTNRIVIFDAEGIFRYQIPGGQVFSSPRDVAVDPDGLILVVANHEGHSAVLELDFDGLFRRAIELTGLPDVELPPMIGSLALSPDGSRLYLIDDANRYLYLADRDGRVGSAIDLAADRSPGTRRDEVISGKVDVYGDRVLVAIATYGQVYTYTLDGSTARPGGDPRVPVPVATASRSPRRSTPRTTCGCSTSSGSCSPAGTWWASGASTEHYGIGNAPGFLYGVLDLALDGHGRLYVTQGFEGPVQVYDGVSPARGFAAPDGGK